MGQRVQGFLMVGSRGKREGASENSKDKGENINNKLIKSQQYVWYDHVYELLKLCTPEWVLQHLKN